VNRPAVASQSTSITPTASTASRTSTAGVSSLTAGVRAVPRLLESQDRGHRQRLRHQAGEGPGRVRLAQHQDTDELFLVIDGQLRIQLQDHDDVLLGPGELFVVPHGVRHCPAADQETRVLLLELQDTVNTGDATRVGTVGERLT
jgi:mannose-6-phosphate isomerase-like protein (cupin superfamily)